MALLEVRDLKIFFYTRNGIVRAVNDISFSIEKGETLGIVGESGSGKSVSIHALLGLIPEPPGKIESGSALFAGTDLLNTTKKNLRSIRGKKISMIFQDPMTSLNPFLKISTQLIEPLIYHENYNKKDATRKAIEALEEVGIHDAANRIHAYPHEFSGGMLQRVMIAMALITQPEILIADEPTTALDVTVQAQILELIKQRQKDTGTAIIFITHDLGVVAGICDRVNVMYAGKILESGLIDNIYYKSKHPYTRALQKSIPSLQEKGEDLYTIQGMPPDLSNEIVGCAFQERCEFVKDICQKSEIKLFEIGAGQKTACIRYQNGELAEI